MAATSATPRFVGRTAELRAVDEALDTAEAGAASTLLVLGDAGIGKSTLVDQAVARAGARDMVVLRGHSLPITGLPYQALGDALTRWCDVPDASPRERLGSAYADLSSLVGPDDISPTTDAPDERTAAQRVLRGTRRLLGHLTTDRPVLLVLEDLHWAHPTTLDLAVWLTRLPRGMPVALVLTVRTPLPPEAGAVRRQLREWTRVASVRRLTLAPFDRDELAEQLAGLLAEVPRRELVDRVFARSGGNPFVAGHLARHPVEPGMPDDLRELLLAPVEGLPEDTRRALRVCAAAGRSVAPTLLGEVLRLDADELASVLRPAVDRHVVVGDAAGTTFAFRHAMLAEALVERLLPGERQQVHARLAEVLAKHPHLAATSVAAELAHHWYLADEPDRSLQASVEAAREAEARHAVASAWGHLERAAATWASVPGAADVAGMTRADLLAWLAELANRAGNNTRAMDAMEQAVAAQTDTGAPHEVARRYDRLAVLHGTAADLHEAERLARRALAVLPEDPPSRERAHALGTVANALWRTRPTAGVHLAEEAVRVADALDDPALRARASTMLGCCLVGAGRWDEGLGHLEHARTVARAGEVPEEVGRAHMYAADMLVRCGRAAEAAAVALAALPHVRAHGTSGKWASGLAANAVSGLFHAGAWDDAERLLAEVEGDTGGTRWLHTVAARLVSFRGHHDDAVARLDEAAALHGGRDPMFHVVALQVDLHRGAHAEARARLDERGDHAVPEHAATRNQLRALGLRALADAAAGASPDAATTGLADALVAELRSPTPVTLAYTEAWRLTALAERSRLDAPDAAAWRAAVDGWDAMDGWDHLGAYARVRLAETLADSDPSAAGLLEEAQATASRLGSPPLAELVADAGGARLPAPPSPGPPPGLDGLTPRETEVLRLVARGRSNREVGDELFITPKTASVHVSNILRKLGASSRTEAAAAAFREGLMTPTAESRDPAGGI